MTTPQPPALQYSALQLAWLQELGIEKPWLPSEQPPASKEIAVVIKQVRTPAATDTVPPAAVMQPAARLPSANKNRSPAPAPVSSTSEQTKVDTQLLAAAATEMHALAETISACQACGLCRERQQAVIGEGVMQPAIMVIGQAPDDLEDRAGKPFVDRSGLMLDNMLMAIKSSRTQNVYVSNIVKCRPPGNRNPKPAELASCKPYLLRQIELVRPFSILAVGRAAQSLLETDQPLDQLRQKTHTFEVAGQKIPLIVTSHPVNLLNHPSEKAAVWQDLQLVKTVSGL